MNTNALVNYLTLLRMQHRAARRDMLIAGGFFYLSATSMVAFGLLAELTGRSVYLMMALVILFGAAYLTAYVRYEVIKGAIGLADNLR